MSHQDWNPVNIGGSTARSKVTSNKRTVLTSIKIDPNASKNSKIDNETTTFKIQKSGQELGKAIINARVAKKLSQKDLAIRINEKPQIIQQYESGKAIPNPQIINKLERNLGTKLPRPKKLKNKH